MLITVHPGPTVCAYQDGKMVAQVSLSKGAALTLILDLVRELKAVDSPSMVDKMEAQLKTAIDNGTLPRYNVGSKSGKET